MLLDVPNRQLGNFILENDSFIVTSFPRRRKTNSPQEGKDCEEGISKEKKIEGFMLFDMCIFHKFISCLACPKWFQCCLSVDEDYNKRKGLACQIILKCDSCD